MRILVMGAGALGSVAGGLMAEAGHDVALVGRAPHMNAISRDGLRISGIWGAHHTRVRQAVARADALDPAPFDWILLAVKSYDTKTAIETVRPLVAETTLVCAYQNGLGNAEAIASQVGWARTVGARVIYGARIVEPGHTEVTVIANPTALGTYDPATPAARVRACAGAMEAAGLPTVYTESIETVLWGKVAYNCALNPLSALLDVPYGALAETEYTRAILRDVVHELYAVGNARGVRLDPASPEAYLELLFEKLIPPTAAHYASMREDFRLGRPTEIEALNGAIARYAHECGAPCPANEMLTRLVHAREHALGIQPR